ncbi:hypothetical protein [Photobacterium leiognathi]|uniref:hypothetical protein n=1 Tax=Photobacterium leiognathi TaxID=553611 RepID=UPI0029825375|nr:hypothetical protein [Photobacterium leiognathi]
MDKLAFSLLAIGTFAMSAIAEPMESRIITTGIWTKNNTLTALKQSVNEQNIKKAAGLTPLQWRTYHPIKMTLGKQSWKQYRLKTIAIKSSTSEAFLYVDLGEEKGEHRLTLQNIAQDNTCQTYVDEKVYGSPMSAGQSSGTSQSITWPLISYDSVKTINKESYQLPKEDYRRYGLDRINEGRKMVSQCSDGSVHTFNLDGFREQYQRVIYDYSRV